MNAEEYAAAQDVITYQAISQTLQISSLIATPTLSTRDWLEALRTLFPTIQRLRDDSARLARSFYDGERHLAYPSMPLNLRPLEGTDWEPFVSNMEPARKLMSVADSPSHALSTFALRTAREVENAGRQQIIHAVDNDPLIDEIHASVSQLVNIASAPASELKDTEVVQPPLQVVKTPQEQAQGQQDTSQIRGWARVATGRETCAWCLMLVSRGPVYRSADSAGLDLDDLNAINLTAAGEDVSGAMQEWHDGCDCKVIPVFKQKAWVGEQAQKRAEELWIEATKVAVEDMEANPNKVYTAGKNKGQIVSLNQRAINALRRRLNAGDIQASEFAGLSLVAS
jgi:hypothetical protein